MAASNKKILRWFGIFVVLLGLVFTAVGGGLSYASYSFTRTAVPTSGVVTDVEVNISSNSTRSGSGGATSFTYRPTISFFDKKGNPHKAQTYLSTSGYNYPVGTKLRIFYNPDDPGQLRLDNWFALWGFGLIFLVLGLFFLIGGLLFLKFSKKAKAQPADTGESKEPARFSYSSQDTSPGPTIRRR